MLGARVSSRGGLCWGSSLWCCGAVGPSSGTPRRHSVGTEPQHTEGAGGAQRFSLEAQGIPWKSGGFAFGLSWQQLPWGCRIHHAEGEPRVSP